MKYGFSAFCLSVLGGLCGLSVSAPASAGVVGEYNDCGSENLSVPVAAMGHSWVAVNALDSASLKNLDALVLRYCADAYRGNAAIDAEVAKGMDFVLDAKFIFSGAQLPGAPAIAFNNEGQCAAHFPIARGAPIRTGPGGVLTDYSLEANPWCSIYGSVPVASLPAGMIPFVLTPNGIGAGAFGYSVGAGQVAVSRSQWSYPGVYQASEAMYPGIKTYFLNVLGWALGQGGRAPEPSVTCASEGYTGTKLTWCRNICEMGYTGATLNLWIKRWTEKYRDLPYCAREK